MTNDLTFEELIPLKRVLETALHDACKHYFKEVRALTGEPEMLDPEGEFGFMVVGFNRFSNIDLLPEDSTEDDLKVAIAAVSAAIMPYIQATDPDGKIGPEETIAHGVHAVATSMLLGTLIGQNVIHNIMANAQSLVLRKRSLQ